MEKKKKLLKFGTEDCQPCNQVDEYLQVLGIKDYRKINPFEEVELGAEYGIRSIPTLVLLDENGLEELRITGGLQQGMKPFQDLKNILQGGIGV